MPPTAPPRVAPLGRASYPDPQPADRAPAGYAAFADRPAVLALVVVAWSAAGASIAVALGRRGHEMASWGALGVVFGPLLAGLAAGAARVRHSVAAPIEVAPGLPGGGDVHVLAGGDAREVGRCARRLRGRTVVVTPAAGPGGGGRR